MLTIRNCVFLVLFASFFLTSELWAQVPLCDGIRESPPPPFNSSDPTAEMDWWADADLIGPPAADMYQMTRVLVNRSDQPRRAYWPVGRMDVTLKAGEWARHCPPPSGGRNEVEGPLSYKSNGTSVSTKVYENFKESTNLEVLKGEPLQYRTSFSRGSKVGQKPEYDFMFTAAVVYDLKQKMYVITYTISNTGKIDENVTIKDIPYSSDTAGQLQPLKAGKSISFKVTTNANPFSKWVNAELSDEVGTLYARIKIVGVLPRNQ